MWLGFSVYDPRSESWVRIQKKDAHNYGSFHGLSNGPLNYDESWRDALCEKQSQNILVCHECCIDYELINLLLTN